jgi:hypothetical protein
LVDALPGKEVSEGQTVWEGVVHVFDLEGHPKATRAYAWSSPIERAPKDGGSSLCCIWAALDRHWMPCERQLLRSIGMGKVEATREAALRRVAEQEARIARQKHLIANLDRDGIASVAAKRVLATMQDTLTALRTSVQHLSS